MVFRDTQAKTNMNKNARIFAIVAVAAAVVLVLAYLGLDYAKGRPDIVDCGPAEGTHPRIDERQFATKYSGYTFSLGLELKDQAKLSASMGENQFQELSDSLQHANERRKTLVASYNGCGITKAQFGQSILKFEALDNTARQITNYTSKPALSDAEKAQLTDLVNQYVAISQSLDHQFSQR
jgi:hypothetical protein